MGTGKLTSKEEEGMGLAGEHDYAVIDAREHEGQQFFRLKNPWSEGTVWKGHNAMNHLSGAFERCDVTATESPVEVDQNCPTPGTFWMTLNEVFQSFDSIYLNWNPRLFSCKEDVHFYWDLASRSSAQGNFVWNPQYIVDSEVGGTLWLLLNRHFTSDHEVSVEGLEVAGQGQNDPGFISLYAFDKGGERVACSDGATYQSAYVDSPNSLLKLELPAGRAFTVVISEQALPRTRNAFTLSAFSLMPVHLFEAREQFTHSIAQSGAWIASTAGGNAGCSTYNINPQFSLRLSDTSDLFIFLESTVQNLPVHVKLVWAMGKQVRCITSRDVVGDSGEYRKGFAFATTRSVQAGAYTLVCSTFEQGQLGDFMLHVKSLSACTLERISRASAGRFVTKIRVATFTPGSERLFARLISQRLNRVSFIAQSCGVKLASKRSAYSPLKLLLEHGHGSSKETIWTSGEDGYLDSHVGVHSPEVDIDPDKCAGKGIWIVIERLASSGIRSNEVIDVELFSEEPIEVHDWSVGRD